MSSGSSGSEGFKRVKATFPSDWPPGCPPNEAQDAGAVVYRITKEISPKPEDFLSWAEIGKSDPDCPCGSVGLSVFRDLSDAVHYIDKFPVLGSFVAKGTLTAEHGKMKLTPRIIHGQPNSHTTWWVYLGVVRHNLFSVVSV